MLTAFSVGCAILYVAGFVMETSTPHRYAHPGRYTAAMLMQFIGAVGLFAALATTLWRLA